MHLRASTLAFAVAFAASAFGQTPTPEPVPFRAISERLISSSMPTFGKELVLRSAADVRRYCRYLGPPLYEPTRDVVAIRGVDAYPSMLEPTEVVRVPLAGGTSRYTVRYRNTFWDGEQIWTQRVFGVAFEAAPGDEVTFEDVTPEPLEGTLGWRPAGDGTRRYVLQRPGGDRFLRIPDALRPHYRALTGATVRVHGTSIGPSALEVSRLEFELDARFDQYADLEFSGYRPLRLSQGGLYSLDKVREVFLRSRPSVAVRGFVIPSGAFLSEVRATLREDYQAPDVHQYGQHRALEKGDGVWIQYGHFLAAPGAWTVRRVVVSPVPGFPWPHYVRSELLDFGQPSAGAAGLTDGLGQ